ncbi:NUDIX domain-containing protein [Kitasatospora sp. NPDC096147]|uniref:NUDIX hydrolase n=1 Tax=Kitasatospora sp. NPDC096147 TaxID=3364093 RepID=UPI003809A9A5
MPKRVRAVLVTPNDTLLLMKRVRPDRPVYWVVVGGKIEPTDTDPEAALRREVREEVGGEARIVRVLHTHRTETDHETFYLADIERWDLAARTGPEFGEEGRGEYLLEEIPLTTAALDAVNLLPPEFAAVLREAVERGTLPAGR